MISGSDPIRTLRQRNEERRAWGHGATSWLNGLTGEILDVCGQVLVVDELTDGLPQSAFPELLVAFRYIECLDLVNPVTDQRPILVLNQDGACVQVVLPPTFIKLGALRRVVPTEVDEDPFSPEAELGLSVAYLPAPLLDPPESSVLPITA